MTRLERQISDAIRAENWSVSMHADDRLAERGIEAWQVVDGFDAGTTLDQDLHATPNPKLMRRTSLADGMTVVAIWALEKRVRVAKLVTVYFIDR